MPTKRILKIRFLKMEEQCSRRLKAQFQGVLCLIIFQKTDEDRALAAKTLVNELPNTMENLERGKVAYGIYCMQCHGEKGDGQGSLYVNKKFIYPPGNLLSEKMRANPEADIYHVITVGWGIMGEHGSMITPDDRWKIAMYVKQELQK